MLALKTIIYTRKLTFFEQTLESFYPVWIDEGSSVPGIEHFQMIALLLFSRHNKNRGSYWQINIVPLREKAQNKINDPLPGIFNTSIFAYRLLHDHLTAATINSLPKCNIFSSIPHSGHIDPKQDF